LQRDCVAGYRLEYEQLVAHWWHDGGNNCALLHGDRAALTFNRQGHTVNSLLLEDTKRPRPRSRSPERALEIP